MSRKPLRLGAQQVELVQRHHRSHQVEGGPQPPQRDAKLVHPLWIATILGGWQRLEQMLKTGP